MALNLSGELVPDQFFSQYPSMVDLQICVTKILKSLSTIAQGPVLAPDLLGDPGEVGCSLELPSEEDPVKSSCSSE